MSHIIQIRDVANGYHVVVGLIERNDNPFISSSTEKVFVFLSLEELLVFIGSFFVMKGGPTAEVVPPSVTDGGPECMPLLHDNASDVNNYQLIETIRDMFKRQK